VNAVLRDLDCQLDAKPRIAVRSTYKDKGEVEAERDDARQCGDQDNTSGELPSASSSDVGELTLCLVRRPRMAVRRHNPLLTKHNAAAMMLVMSERLRRGQSRFDASSNGRAVRKVVSGK
jgi:hypothetical protein